MIMRMRSFGELNDGRKAGLYILRNESGMEVSLTDYGATLVSVIVPDRHGEGVDVVLGHDDVSGYENGHGSIGATVGRFANRIGGASFTIGRNSYRLTANNGPNTLHGGRDPYSDRLWGVKMPFTKVSSGNLAVTYAAESISDSGSAHARESLEPKQITFCLESPDGDQGFPGNLYIEVTYTLTDDCELHIDYRAISDADTPLNLTNHSYFNLAGHDSGTVLGQLLGINAAYFTPNDENTLPTGEIRPVEGTPMDFRTTKPIGADMESSYEQLVKCSGYDHNYVIDGEGYRKAAVLHSEESGITMEVLTDLPGMQLYTGNFLDSEPGKGWSIYGKNAGVCFETQFFPDAVNRENFPGGVLRAGEAFISRTTYRWRNI